MKSNRKQRLIFFLNERGTLQFAPFLPLPNAQYTGNVAEATGCLEE